MINFITNFTLGRLQRYFFRYFNIVRIKMKISPFIFECCSISHTGMIAKNNKFSNVAINLDAPTLPSLLRQLSMSEDKIQK